MKLERDRKHRSVNMKVSCTSIYTKLVDVLLPCFLNSKHFPDFSQGNVSKTFTCVSVDLL